MRVAILGASGQIGSVIYNGLKETYEVVGTSRKASGEHIPFDPFQHDWSPLGDVDVLVNCVGQIQTTRASSFRHIHVDLTKQIIRHRRDIGNPYIIQVSALGASPSHKVEFLRTKGIADELLLRQPRTAVIRPSIVCTHRTMLVRKMLMVSKMSRLFSGWILVPRGFPETKIQPIMPEDLAALMEKMCEHPNERIVNAVGGEAITFREIIQLMMGCQTQKMKIAVVSRRLSDPVVKIGSRFFPGLINSQQYQLLFEDNVSDDGVAERLLGRPLSDARPFFKKEFSCPPLN